MPMRYLVLTNDSLRALDTTSATEVVFDFPRVLGELGQTETLERLSRALDTSKSAPVVLSGKTISLTATGIAELRRASRSDEWPRVTGWTVEVEGRGAGASMTRLRVAIEWSGSRLDAQSVLSSIPSALREGAEKFFALYPDPSTMVFVAMQFGSSASHTVLADRIYGAIRKSLLFRGLRSIRADERHFSRMLLDNVLTQIWCCGRFVSVFERVETDAFNPNVSLEVGYAMALRRDVLLLKERTLRALPTDLVGALYSSFNIHDIDPTIDTALAHWLQ
jgi:hypothetical protein